MRWWRGLDTVSTRLADLGAQIHTQQARLVETGNQLAAQPERGVTQVRQVQAQTALEQLETTEAQLENHRIELATKFKPTDRLVAEVDQQIASTQAQIARLRADRMTEETTDVDPLHQSMKADASRTVVDLKGLQAERSSLEQTRGTVLAQLEDDGQRLARACNPGAAGAPGPRTATRWRRTTWKRRGSLARWTEKNFPTW